LLDEIKRAREESKKISREETQKFIVRFKEEKPELKGVYSRLLQMVN
jgi:putative transposase